MVDGEKCSTSTKVGLWLKWIDCEEDVISYHIIVMVLMIPDHIAVFSEMRRLTT